MPVRIIEPAVTEETKNRVRIIEEAPKAAPAKPVTRSAGIIDPFHDLGRAVRPAADKLASTYQQFSKTGRGDALGALAGVPLAVLQGLTTNQVTGPASRALAATPLPIYDGNAYGAPQALQGDQRQQAFEGALNTALMGVKPGRGFKPPAPLPKIAKAPKSEMRVGQAVERALQRDAVLPGDLKTSMASSPGVPAFQAGGENLTGLAEVVAQSPGPGQRIVRQAVRNHQAGATDRVQAEAAKSLGGTGDYFAKLDELNIARRTEAKTVMDKLGPQPVALDQNSILALRSDLAKTAIKDAAANALASPDPMVRESGARLNRLGADVLDRPGGQSITLRDAQDISRSLLDAADSAYRAGDGGRGAALKGLGRAIRSNAADPKAGGLAEYGDWLKKYGDDSDSISALELGRDMFKNSKDMSAEKLKSELGGMSEAALDNYRKGVGEAVVAQARSSKGGVGAARQLLKSREFGDRAELAFPDKTSFNRFMTSIEQEVLRQDRNNRVVGGSPTYARGSARADLEAQGSGPMDALASTLEGVLNPGKIPAAALKEAIKSLPRKDRSLIGDPAMNEALGRALSDPDEMTRLLNLMEAQRVRKANGGAAALRRALPLLPTAAGALGEKRGGSTLATGQR